MFLEKKIFGGIMKYQVGFKQFFCLRLLRSAYVTFLKTGCKYQNVMTSGIYRTHYIYEIIHPDTCQSQITLPISIWDTLYHAGDVNSWSQKRAHLKYWFSHPVGHIAIGQLQSTCLPSIVWHHVSAKWFRLMPHPYIISHLAWADFKIKVKQKVHSKLQFDQWKPLISKM